MKLSILLLVATMEALTLGSMVLDTDEYMLQALYARQEILPRGDGQSSGGFPGFNQGQSSHPNPVAQTGPRATSPRASSSPGSPPDSPRTAGRKADAAEAKAKEARQNFRRTGEHHLGRMKEFMRAPDDRNIDVAHNNRMAMLNEYRAVPRAKEAEAAANKEAAEAARKAGRVDRQDRYTRKAAASAVEAQFHHANLDMQQHASTGLHQYTRYQRGSHLLGIEAPWVDEARVAAQNAESNEDKTRRKMSGLYAETKRLRQHEGGMDTDSTASDTSG